MAKTLRIWAVAFQFFCDHGNWNCVLTEHSSTVQDPCDHRIPQGLREACHQRIICRPVAINLATPLRMIPICPQMNTNDTWWNVKILKRSTCWACFANRAVSPTFHRAALVPIPHHPTLRQKCWIGHSNDAARNKPAPATTATTTVYQCLSSLPHPALMQYLLLNIGPLGSIKHFFKSCWSTVT